MKNFDIFRVHRKIRFLVGGVYKKQIFRGDCRKRIGLDSLQIKGGLGKIEGRDVFEGVVDTPVIEQECMENSLFVKVVALALKQFSPIHENGPK